MAKEKLSKLNDKFIKEFDEVGVSKDIIEEYVAQGADVNYRQANTGFTPLIAAAEGWRLHGCVKSLLEDYKVDPNVKDNTNETAFTRAINKTNWGSALYLLMNGADIKIRGSQIKIPNIASATIYILGGAQLKKLEHVKKGVEIGGDINSKERFNSGETALSIAIKFGLFDIAKFALENNASIQNLKQNSSMPSTAAEKKKMKELLTKYGVPLNK